MTETVPPSGMAALDFSTLDVLDSGAVVLNAQHRVRHWNAWMVQASGIVSRSVV